MEKRTIYFLMILVVAAFMASCDDNTTGTDDPEPEIEINTVENLDATSDDHYTFFSFRTGDVVSRTDSASLDWDIAIRGTSVLTNSGSSGPGEAGAILLDLPFNQIEMAPSEGYAVDTEEEPAIKGRDGWYIYTGHEGTPPLHAIIPIDDVTIVLKTADGNHYVKLEMISYYYDNPDTSTEEFANTDTRPENRYYTFRYAIQQTEDLRELN